MIEATDLIRAFLQGIRELSGASAAALYVPPSLAGDSPPMLVHSGDATAVAELTELESAGEAMTRASRAESAGPSPTVLNGRAPDTALVLLPAPDSDWFREGGGRDKKTRLADRAKGGGAPSACLGLKIASGAAVVEGWLKHPVPQTRTQWEWLFGLGGLMAGHSSLVAAVLRDPMTGLPSRTGVHAILGDAVERARVESRPFALLLVNPDDFAEVNERVGREAGDRIVREISERLRNELRGSDTVLRYGGVIFAALLDGTDAESAREVAEKLRSRLAGGSFLDGELELAFSVGIALADPADDESLAPMSLIRRADQALSAAKKSGGDRVTTWSEDIFEEAAGFDPLVGIFTGNAGKDYRNMVLLTEALEAIAVNTDSAGLAREVVQRLFASFKAQRAALFGRDEEGELFLARGLTRSAPGGARQRRLETVELDPRGGELLELAVAGARPRQVADRDGDLTLVRFAIPLVAGEKCLGCLYIDGIEGTLLVEAADLHFLETLAAQLAVALDRAQLSERERLREEFEKKSLRAELNELRQALQQAKLVYRSEKIEQLLATAQRVAPTDATVLITGESGTGKELLSRTVHELSPRRDKPMVVVDCGAIATTLIESELFGHEKGAYTGAQERRVGRLAEADGGTVLLDEIGELPLEVQSKLLRFVQEKQFVPVGGTQPRRVDVRIIAATNRDLAAEVAQGSFREDLYYRLNVVRLEIPPLRERPDDVLHLAHHFLKTYSVQYQKPTPRLTPEAEETLARYPWPGNVRELQNRLMQAVILCEEELGVEQLNLPQHEPQPAGDAAPTAPATPRSGSATDAATQAPESAAGVLERLRRALAHQIDLALAAGSRAAFPLGKWLGDDLVLEANEAAGGVARRAAAQVGVPETTFRRRLRKASQQAEAGLSARAADWGEVRSLLAEVVATHVDDGSDLFEATERILLEQILERVHNDVTAQSNLLGVTPPTLRSRIARLRETQSG